MTDNKKLVRPNLACLAYLKVGIINNWLLRMVNISNCFDLESITNLSKQEVLSFLLFFH